MESIATDIWAHEDTMRLMGTTFRLRMTVIKLSSGKLWVHSPTKLSAALKTAVEQLGEVAFIVGASNNHNLWLLEWSHAFPEAKLYVSKGITKKIQLTGHTVLDESSAEIWNEDLDCSSMSGVPFFDETVFLHRPSKSLIVSDFVQNHTDHPPKGLAGLITKCIFQPMGFKGICTAPPLNMGFTIKDTVKFKAFVSKVKSWSFDRIIVTHGDIIETNAKQRLDDLCQRFLG